MVSALEAGAETRSGLTTSTRRDTSRPVVAGGRLDKQLRWEITCRSHPVLDRGRRNNSLATASLLTDVFVWLGDNPEGQSEGDRAVRSLTRPRAGVLPN